MSKFILRIGVFTVFLVSVVFSTNARSQQTRLPTSFSLQVNGQVRFSESNTPADNVLVRIESFTGGLVGQVMTDRTGKFSFNGLQPQQYIVTIHSPGYIDIRENINLSTSSSSYINALLIQDRASIQANRANIISLSPSVIDASVPAEAKAEFTKGKTLLDTGKKEKITESLQYFEKALQIYPKFLDAQLLLGLGYMDLQEWDKAETALKSAIEINANATTAYLALGEVYRRQKKYTEAEKTLLDGIKINDNSAEIHNELAKVYWEMAPAAKTEQEFKTALGNSWKEVRKTLQLNAKLPDANLLAGNLLLKAGRGKDALGYFEEYLKLDTERRICGTNSNIGEKDQEIFSGRKKIVFNLTENKNIGIFVPVFFLTEFLIRFFFPHKIFL